MNILCSICRELFTGADNEKIYATICGHVFHHMCLFQWIQRSKSCPQCRTKLTNKNMIKLNLHVEGSAAPKTGIEDHVQTNLQFELHMKEIELRQLRESCKVATERNKGLKKETKKFESEIMSAKSRECQLLQEVKKLKVELRHERQKNSRLSIFASREAQHGAIVHELIDLNDSDPTLLIDIDENIQAGRSNSNRDEDPEVINLDESEMEDVHPHEQPNRAEVEDLKSQLELKEVLLSSAVARIAELEGEIRTLKQNNEV